MKGNFNDLTKEELKDFKYTDVHIVYIKTKRQARKVQHKFNRMGFKHNGFINDKIECYYLSQILVSNDFRNGNRHQVWGRSEVEKSKFFNDSLISYNDFMSI